MAHAPRVRFSCLLLLGVSSCVGSLSSEGEDMPGGGNNANDPEVAPWIQFSTPRGFFEGPVAVSLASDQPHDEIRVTRDGSKPTATHGDVYADPMTVSGTSLIRAVLIRDGQAVGPVVTHSYLFASDVFNQGDLRPAGDYVFWTTEMDPTITNDPAYRSELEAALYSIPTLSLVTDPEHLFGVAGIHRGNNLMDADEGPQAGAPNHPDWVDEIEASLELIYPAEYPRGTYPGFQTNAGVKVQGGGGRWDNGNYDHKQSFGLRFRKTYGAGSLRYPIFEDAPLHGEGEAGKYDKLVLRAGHNKSWGATWDNAHTAYTRDQLGRDLQIDASGYGARGTFVHLFLSGQYWGLYNLTERPDDAHNANYFGGQEEEWYSGKGRGGTVDGDSSRYNTWRNTVAASGDFSQLQQYLAVNEYLDMCLLNAYANTGDFPQFYFGNRMGAEPGPIYFYNWDLEDSFGGDSKRTGPPSNHVFNDNACYMFSTMWDSTPEFRGRLAQRALALTQPGGALSDANTMSSWTALNDYIESAMVLESARWGDERIADTGVRYTRDQHWRSARDLVMRDLSGRANLFLQMLRNTTRNGTPYLP